MLTCFLDRPRGAHRSFDTPGLCVVWCGAYVFPRQASGSPQILRQAPPMCVPGLTSYARPYLLCGVQCPALLLTCGAWPYFDRPGLCAVPGVLCFAYVRCGAVLCFASTGPGVLRQPPLTSYVLCGALLTSTAPWPYLRQPPPMCFALPGFASTPPGGALLALLMCLRVFYTY